jgi:Kef-type K+ transport system membrane component KefB
VMEFGIAVLLFVVGLKLDVRVIRVLGPVALGAGLGQIVLTALLAFAIATAFGFGVVTAGYLAMAMAFSSTIIVVKLLTDRRELKVLHGRIAIGILIVQDIVPGRADARADQRVLAHPGRARCGTGPHR